MSALAAPLARVGAWVVGGVLLHVTSSLAQTTQPPAVVPAASASGSGQPLAIPSASASVSIPPPTTSASASVPSPSARPVPTAVPSAPVSSAPAVREGAPPIGQGPSRAWNVFYVESGGAAFAWSVNYELDPVSFLGFRAGYGVLGVRLVGDGHAGSSSVTHFIPVTAYALIGGQPHRVELGGGATFIHPGGLRIAAFDVGYRYQPEESASLFLRIAFTPLLFFSTHVDLLPWGAAAAGVTF